MTRIEQFRAVRLDLKKNFAHLVSSGLLITLVVAVIVQFFVPEDPWMEIVAIQAKYDRNTHEIIVHEVARTLEECHTDQRKFVTVIDDERVPRVFDVPHFAVAFTAIPSFSDDPLVIPWLDLNGLPLRTQPVKISVTVECSGSAANGEAFVQFMGEARRTPRIQGPHLRPEAMQGP